MQTVILLIDWVLSRRNALSMISMYCCWFMNCLFISVSKLFQLQSSYSILVLLLKVVIFWNTPVDAVLENRVMFLRSVVSLSFLSCSSYHCILHSSLYVFGHFLRWDEIAIHLFFTGGQWWLHYLAPCTNQWKAKCVCQSLTKNEECTYTISHHHGLWTGTMV